MGTTRDKGVVVSVRVDSHLADVLNKVPDKVIVHPGCDPAEFIPDLPGLPRRGVLPKEILRWASG